MASIQSEWPTEVLAEVDVHRVKVTVKDRVTQAFTESHHEVYRYALSCGLDPGQAQEITQDTFLRLYLAFDKGEKIENQRAWLFRVAHNLGLNRRRREDRLGPLPAGLGEQIADSSATPEQTLLEQERMRRLHQAVEGLSEQQRRCLYLRAEGFRYREIAHIVGIQTSTVGEFLRRAIDRLRKARA